MINGDIQKTCSRGGRGGEREGVEIPCMFSVSSEHIKLLHRFEKYVIDVLSKK